MNKRTIIYLGLLIAGTTLTGLKVAKEFAPPRTAVVSITEVFDTYQKKVDQQSVIDKSLADLKLRHKQMVQDLKTAQRDERLIESGPEKNKLQIDIIRQKAEIEQFEQLELNSLQQQYVHILQQIRTEIREEIRLYAEAMDIDLVLDKAIDAQVDPRGPPLKWDFVHYAKPELDITSDVAERLNERYRKSR